MAGVMLVEIGGGSGGVEGLDATVIISELPVACSKSSKHEECNEMK